MLFSRLILLVLQKIGVWFSCLNSTANPLVYMSVMPIFRRSLRKTFLPWCVKRDPAQGSLSLSCTTQSTVVNKPGSPCRDESTRTKPSQHATVVNSGHDASENVTRLTLTPTEEVPECAENSYI